MSWSAIVDGDITFYTTEPFLETQEIITYCQRAAINKHKVLYEQEVFIEEFDTKDYKIRVYDKFIQKNIHKKRSSSPYRVPYQKLLDYVTTYYLHGNYVVYDNETWQIYAHKLPPTSVQESTIGTYISTSILVDGEKNHIICCQNPHPLDIYLCGFLEQLCDAIDIYHKRYIAGSYYRHSSSCVITKEHIYLRLSPHLQNTCTESFIETYKAIYIEKYIHNCFPTQDIRTHLYRWTKVDQATVIKMIMSLTPTQINTLLGSYFTLT